METNLAENIPLLVKDRHLLQNYVLASSIISAATNFEKWLGNLEESLLRLSNGHTEGLFYTMVLRIKLTASQNKQIYLVRFFETGLFQGCLKTSMSDLFGEDFNSDTGNDSTVLIPWKVYTEEDIETFDSSVSARKGIRFI